MNRLLLFGDTGGVKQLLRHVPLDAIGGICMSSIRPQYFDELQSIADVVEVPILIQPRESEATFEEFRKAVLALRVDRALAHSYSIRIPKTVLELFPKGSFNIHGSLLPKNRGPNPIQWALIKGERITGVTLHEMSAEIDQGGLVDQISVKIKRGDNWLTLRDKLEVETDSLIRRNLDALLNGEITSTPQNEAEATKNRRRTPDDNFFDWSNPLQYVYRLHKAALPPLSPATATDCAGRSFSFTNQASFLAVAFLVSKARVRCLFTRGVWQNLVPKSLRK